MTVDKSILYSSKTTLHKTLQLYFGIGRALASKICSRFGISPSIRISEISSFKLKEIYTYLSQNLILESILRYRETENKRKLVSSKSFRGLRLIRGLPTRGQRTKSNGRTQKKRPQKQFVQN